MLNKSKVSAQSSPDKTIRQVIARADHPISRKNIPDNVLKILHRLNQAGFEAYLVGGCVRDLMAGQKPKDFDITTNALPEEVRDLFRNCRLIGKRFRLAHIYFKQDIIEVATFRGGQENTDDDGMLRHDNIYGTMEEDAFRRDFTVNALFYTTKDFSIIDYTNGVADIQKGLIRMIGDADKRYREDPVRILRAIRFISKLNFKFDTATEAPIKLLGHLLQQVPSARLFHEAIKLFHGGYALPCFHHLQKYDLLSWILPDVNTMIDEKHPYIEKMIHAALANTDERLANDKTASPVFLFAMLLWYPCMTTYQDAIERAPHQPALDHATHQVMLTQTKRLCIPKRLSHAVKEIWRLQFLLEKKPKHFIGHIFHHPRFRAAYDLLLLRQSAGEKDINDCTAWWTDFINADSDTKTALVHTLQTQKKRRKKKKEEA